MAFRCGAGIVTEVSYFALRLVTPECFLSLSQKTIAPLTPTFSTMTAAASEFHPFLAERDRSPRSGGHPE